MTRDSGGYRAMVDISDFFDEGGEPEDAPEGEGEDLVALKDCLQALADAIASTNLAVIQGGQGDMPAATARVHASIAALKRFHDAFKVLKGPDEPVDAEETAADAD